MMKFIICLSFLVSIFSCKNVNIQDSKKIDLEGTDLFFIGINGPSIDSFNLPPYKLNLTNRQYTLSLDVNSCSGTYKMKGKEIKFNNDLSCTKVCCDGPNAQALKEILKSNFIVKKEGENFILNQGGLQLKLSKNAPQKNSALIGKKYLVSKAFSMGNEYKPDFEMTLSFTDQSMELQLDANACTAACEISSDQIKLEAMGCTEKCCDSELARSISAMFSGTMQYVIDAENPVIFNKNSRIWLVPFVEGKKEGKAQNAADLIGKDYKIIDLTFLPQGPDASAPILVKYAFDYILSFKEEGLGLKLDVNSCNSSATYSGNNIEIGNQMGCTKMCCDSKESAEIKNNLKGKFNVTSKGNNIILQNEKLIIKIAPIR